MAVFIGEIPKGFVKTPDPAERYNELIALAFYRLRLFEQIILA